AAPLRPIADTTVFGPIATALVTHAIAEAPAFGAVANGAVFRPIFSAFVAYAITETAAIGSFGLAIDAAVEPAINPAIRPQVLRAARTRRGPIRVALSWRQTPLAWISDGSDIAAPLLSVCAALTARSLTRPLTVAAIGAVALTRSLAVGAIVRARALPVSAAIPARLFGCRAGAGIARRRRGGARGRLSRGGGDRKSERGGECRKRAAPEQQGQIHKCLQCCRATTCGQG
ncbi:MAG: hypothetical protein AAFR32_10245, partial [Pseudomonadota bacterium]